MLVPNHIVRKNNTNPGMSENNKVCSISHLKRELLQQPPTSHSTLHSVCVSVVETEAH